jgi:hypothetical protein
VTLDAKQILALAPDPASAKAGSQLAVAHQWSNLGNSEAALWGECQGSGKTPYKTQVDLNGPAFKCSCPSRKFPCKHGLGLYLLSAAEPALFAAGAEPQWQQPRPVSVKKSAKTRSMPACGSCRPGCTTWRAKVSPRGARAARTCVTGSPRALPTPRRRRSLAGSVPPAVFFTSRTCAPVNADSLVANELASIYLPTQAWQRRGQLSPPLQADVRALLGCTVSQDEVLRQPGVEGCWRVLAETTSDDERLRVRATWLHGPDARWALLLQYAAGAQGFEQQLSPGTEFDGELCFHPGAYPLHAQIRRQENVRPLAHVGAAPSDLDTLLDTHADALAVQPFLERNPVLLTARRAWRRWPPRSG